MNKVIFLNGPAGSGKDTIGRFLADKLERASIYKFADPLKKAVSAFFDLTPEEYQFYFETQQGKNNPSPRFNNKTPREWLIGFSEDYAKKYGGKHVFGTIMANKLTSNFNSGVTKTALITDSGFTEEAEEVLNRFGTTVEFFIVRLHRNGYNFTGDSRGYVYLEKEHRLVHALDINNEEGRVEDAVQKILQEIEWDRESVEVYPDGCFTGMPIDFDFP